MLEHTRNQMSMSTRNLHHGIHGIAGLIILSMLLSFAGCASSTDMLRVQEAEVHTFRLEYNNSHLVVHDGKSILIDSGLAEDAAELDAAIREAGLDPAQLEAVILTHGHADHAGGALHFKQTYGTPIIAGLGDQHLMDAGRNDLDTFCPTDFTAEGRVEEDRDATYEPTAADIWIDAATPLESLTSVPGEIVPMPGHTPGSLVVIVGDAVLVGDLFRGAIVGGGAETHFYMCDLEDNRNDIRELLETLAPAATTYFAGHFGPLDREDVEELLED